MGWQVYGLTNSALDLGLIGLAQFTASALFTLAAGHVADRFDRKRIVQICQAIEGVTAAGLAWGSFAGWLNIWDIYAAVAMLGAAAAFEEPAAAALLPAVSAAGNLPRAAALLTAAFQIAVIVGPALGGVLYAVAPAAPYVGMSLLWATASCLTGAMRISRQADGVRPKQPGQLFGAVGFLRSHPAILGIISLDLFAVLLGGATALLPIYARDILHVGPSGLGILRSAPAVGALAMTAVLMRHPIERRAGMRMFQAVVVFGLATVLFAVSRQVWLSIAALAILGAADTVSMIIRISFVQLSTPDGMRGRVSAINLLFVHASNELGQFESGIAAALLGPIGAVILGDSAPLPWLCSGCGCSQVFAD